MPFQPWGEPFARQSAPAHQSFKASLAVGNIAQGLLLIHRPSCPAGDDLLPEPAIPDLCTAGAILAIFPDMPRKRCEFARAEILRMATQRDVQQRRSAAAIAGDIDHLSWGRGGNEVARQVMCPGQAPSRIARKSR